MSESITERARALLARKSADRWGEKCAEHRLYEKGQLDTHPPMLAVMDLLAILDAYEAGDRPRRGQAMPDLADDLVTEAREILAQQVEGLWGKSSSIARHYRSGLLDDRPAMFAVVGLLQERRDLQALVRSYQAQYPHLGPDTAGQHPGGKNCSQGL
jgi:hypothetical protein